MEALINNEVEEFVTYLRQEALAAPQNAIEIHNVYNITILNALWRIISGIFDQHLTGVDQNDIQIGLLY